MRSPPPVSLDLSLDRTGEPLRHLPDQSIPAVALTTTRTNSLLFSVEMDGFDLQDVRQKLFMVEKPLIGMPGQRCLRRWYGMKKFEDSVDLDYDVSDLNPSFQLYSCRRYIPPVEDSAVSSYITEMEDSNQSLSSSDSEMISLTHRPPTPDPRQGGGGQLNSQQRHYWDDPSQPSQSLLPRVPETMTETNSRTMLSSESMFDTRIVNETLPDLPEDFQEDGDSLQNLLMTGHSLSESDQARIAELLENLYQESSPPGGTIRGERIGPVPVTSASALSPEAPPFVPAVAKRLNTTSVSDLQARLLQAESDEHSRDHYESPRYLSIDEFNLLNTSELDHRLLPDNELHELTEQPRPVLAPAQPSSQASGVK